jgi:L-threonylcarbamoyladenylate synthase
MSRAPQGDDAVLRAAEILRRGGVVAFPTETVYGLGADATNSAAVVRIFAIKGRPSSNPLIVHVADEPAARQHAREWPEAAEKLARAFWPGPLTLVVPMARHIVPAVAAGRDTVGLRAPDHPLALQLLRQFGGPIAAPSANRSNRVSPTTADHVRRELGDRVELILDGGPCRVGIESTVVDVSRGQPVILRPGGIDRESIERLVGPVLVARQAAASVSPVLQFRADDETNAALSPGRQPIHYSPAAEAFRFDPADAPAVRYWCARHADRIVTILSLGQAEWIACDERSRIESSELAAELPRLNVIAMPTGPTEYARQLYARLHEADDRGSARIYIEMPPDEAAWQAIRDRLHRATRRIENKCD